MGSSGCTACPVGSTGNGSFCACNAAVGYCSGSSANNCVKCSTIQNTASKGGGPWDLIYVVVSVGVFSGILIILKHYLALRNRGRHGADDWSTVGRNYAVIARQIVSKGRRGEGGMHNLYVEYFLF